MRPASSIPADTAGSFPVRCRNARIGPILVLVVTVPVLTVAALLEADPTGLGTHTQLGLPACGFHRTVGVPCVTCGYTTAFAYAARGDLIAALRAQPAGAVLAVLTAALVIVGGYGLVAGVSLAPLGRWLWRPRFIWIGGAACLVAWFYKILMVFEVIS